MGTRRLLDTRGVASDRLRRHALSMERRLEEFPIRSTDKIRYADTDRQGHVNNALFATFLETGRVELLYDTQRPLAAEGAEFVIARLSLDFRREIHWPGTVEVGTGVSKVGNSSVTLEQGLFQHEECVARAETVIVQVDSDARKARALTDEARSHLHQLRLTAISASRAPAPSARR